MSEKKVGKRLLTWVLVLVMTLSLLPLNVLADEIPLDEPTGEEAMIETGDATFDEPELAAYQNRKSTTKDAQFYYLKSPNSNPDKNDSSEFGPKLGNGTIDIKDLDFKFDWDSFSYKNAYNVGGCVISWPDNVGDGGVLAKNTTPGSDWMTIFNAFKSDYEDKNGIQAGTLTTGDVISITLKPHKVSRYNSTRPDHHVDCTVEIICNGVQNVRFFVKDASASEYQQHGKGQSVMVGNAVTFPTDLLQTKTVDGVDYTFKGWYLGSYDNTAPNTSSTAYDNGDNPYTVNEGGKNIGFYAYYEPVATNTYTITWYDEDGTTVLGTRENVPYGTSAEEVEKLAPANPTKTSDAQYDYTFKSWDKPYAEVTGNQTYTAQFTETTRKYTIIWYDEDGTTVLGTATLPYGASADQVKAKAPADPTKAASGRYTYKFDKWTPDYAPVEGNQVYKATYKSTYHRPSTPTKPTVEIEDDDALGLNTTDHFAYIVGYGNGEVRPQNNITRAEVATIFFRLLTDDVRDENLTKTNRYSDVTRADWYNTAVSTLSSMGIITGYPDGTFRPNAAITRAEFAAIAARFDNDGDKTAAKFSDIATHWAKDEISIAYNNGWITGYPDGTFGPQRDITRAETMTLVNRVLNRQPETEDDLLPNMTVWTDNANPNAWYYLAVQEATNSHYYKFKTNSKYEKWTELRETRDWTLLEK